MKRKLGICTVISFVFAGLSAPAFLFSVYFLATYCIGGTPTGDGSPAASPSVVLSVICLVAAVAAIAAVVVFAVRIVKTRTRKSRVFYMVGCFALAVLGTVIANVTQRADLFLLWKLLGITDMPGMSVIVSIVYLQLCSTFPVVAGILAIPGVASREYRKSAGTSSGEV